MKKLKLGIIGHGFVGKAVDNGFKKDVDTFIVDPNYKTTISQMYQYFLPDIIFIAVPTPMGENGEIDSSIIEKVFLELSQFDHKPIVVIKSTVTPKVLEKVKLIYDRIIFNPEFLTERNADEDFINATSLIISGDNKDDMEYVTQVFEDHSLCNSFDPYYVDLTAAALIKYTINSFLASKVLFFNQINKIFNHSGSTTPWNNFVDAILSDTRIGQSHVNVPGLDGRYGFGGACFPKDTAALVDYANKLNVPFKVLEETIRSNQIIRQQYSELDEREKEQNVKFDIL
jgi:nucleotide sugar dehydrogenase